MWLEEAPACLMLGRQRGAVGLGRVREQPWLETWWGEEDGGWQHFQKSNPGLGFPVTAFLPAVLNNAGVCQERVSPTACERFSPVGPITQTQPQQRGLCPPRLPAAAPAVRGTAGLKGLGASPAS